MNDSYIYHKISRDKCSEEEAITSAYTFYQNLYKSPSISDKAADHFLQNLPHISAENNKQLMKPISTKELSDLILSLPNNKTPGPDGLTYEFYKSFIQSISPIMVEHFNKILETAEIPISWKESYLILIPKKSSEKHLIQNWQPIALTNTDYKIFTKILANRLNKGIIQKIMGNHQNGFIKNRSILNNILDIDTILNQY